MDDYRLRYMDFILNQEGKYYCWPTDENNYSGKGLKNAKYPETFDCSGLVTAGLYRASGGSTDYRATHNCNKLWNLLEDVAEPEMGDLAFYGPGKNMVTHVMTVLGHIGSNLAVYGACGGDSAVVTPVIAKAKGARVRLRNSHLYRPDFLGFKRLPKESR